MGNATIAAWMNPARYVDAGDAPAYFAHGTADVTVSVCNTYHVHAAALDAGIDATVDFVDAAGHVDIQSDALVDDAIIPFLRARLD
mmetsp:Transcript_19950/g.79558  ORF Transcript_19950/g.79558 Transcript_19950/m.79558 type:complete len:86 (-) Transcript_19950:194-451(-)